MVRQHIYIDAVPAALPLHLNINANTMAADDLVTSWVSMVAKWLSI